MITYCTFPQVVNMASEFQRDAADGLITPEEQADVLGRATVIVQQIVRPHYELSVINGYDPYPPVIVELARCIAAAILVESYELSISAEKIGVMLARWREREQQYRDVLANAALLDADGVLVPAATSATLLTLASSDVLGEVIDASRY